MMERTSDSHGKSARDPIPLKLGYLVSQYPAINHTFILREIQELRRLGFDIRVASVRGPDRAPSEMTADERQELEHTHYIRTSGIAHALRCCVQTMAFRPMGYLRGLLCIFRLSGLDLAAIFWNLLYLTEAVVAGVWMQEQGLTHVHTHFASTVALLLSKVFPADISMTIHGEAEFIDPKGFHMTAKIAASRFVCVISQYARSQLMKTANYSDWGKFEVCSLGVNTRVFAPSEFRTRPGPFQIISVGRLAAVKGHHILVSAVDHLIQSGKRVQVRLVGDGPERLSLEEHIRRRGLSAYFTFEGAANQDRVLALYREADCFVLSSFAEGIPVVLMEAMAMEIACVATWIAGIPELIENGTDGLLAAPSDDQALARCVIQLMDDQELRLRIGKAGRVKVIHKYNLERNVELLARVFENRIQ
jgi:colanic acid/amylovoran biosynthesis glycosyltransferase